MIEFDTIAKGILDHYGRNKQELQTVQELSELILLLAARPDQRKEDYKNRVTEEIADCMIMMEQIRLANEILISDVSFMIEKKIKRQLGRIKEEAEK